MKIKMMSISKFKLIKILMEFIIPLYSSHHKMSYEGYQIL